MNNRINGYSRLEHIMLHNVIVWNRNLKLNRTGLDPEFSISFTWSWLESESIEYIFLALFRETACNATVLTCHVCSSAEFCMSAIDSRSLTSSICRLTVIASNFSMSTMQPNFSVISLSHSSLSRVMRWSKSRRSFTSSTCCLLASLKSKRIVFRT